MTRITCLGFLTMTLVAVSAQAQPADPTKAYIDNGFAAMDFNKDGKVDRAEFDRFMRARLARQAAAFDNAFAQLDANKDGKISKAEAEAGAYPLLAQHFGEVDANHDGGIDKNELRSAMLQVQAHEQGFN